MKTKLAFISIPLLALLGVNPIWGTTIPAGTTLVVRTLEGMTSVDAVGTRVPAELAGNVVLNGKVLLHSGTRFSARVVTSRRIHLSNAKFTVDITEAIIGGKSVPVRTTGAYQVDNTRFKTRNDISVSRAGYPVQVGRLLHYRLAQPMHF
jgi:hypothetical protein